MELSELDGRLAALERGTEKVWSQRRVDKREAKADADGRHREVMAAIGNVNGTVREHGERLIAVETRCDSNHTFVKQAASGEHDLTGRASNQKLAAQAGGYAGGTVVTLWIVYQIIAKIIEAIQAAQLAGSA